MVSGRLQKLLDSKGIMILCLWDRHVDQNYNIWWVTDETVIYVTIEIFRGI